MSDSEEHKNEIFIFSGPISTNFKQTRLKTPAESALRSTLTNIVCSESDASTSQHGLDFYQGYLFKSDDFIPVRSFQNLCF